MKKSQKPTQAEPSEHDIVTHVAGLFLKKRWGNWNPEPVTSTSDNCVSVYAH
jgi:hypothetical protein